MSRSSWRPPSARGLAWRLFPEATRQRVRLWQGDKELSTIIHRGMIVPRIIRQYAIHTRYHGTCYYRTYLNNINVLSGNTAGRYRRSHNIRLSLIIHESKRWDRSSQRHATIAPQTWQLTTSTMKMGSRGWTIFRLTLNCHGPLEPPTALVQTNMVPINSPVIEMDASSSHTINGG